MIGSRGTAIALGLAMWLTSTGTRGQDAANKAIDAKVNAGVFKTIDTGFRLFNAGDQAGCYRVYQGALVALAPLLDYRPDLKATVETTLADSERLPDYASRAFVLRKALDAVYTATTGPKPLWTRLGGEPAVKAVVHDFMGLIAADPKVDFTRGGKYKLDAEAVAKAEKMLMNLVSDTTGGPYKYTGRSMREVHKGMGITEAQFQAAAADLIATLDKYKVPQKEKDELVGIIASTKPEIVEDGSAVPPPPPMPEKMAEKPKAEKAKDEKSLWDRLGGEPAVKAVVHDFVAKAAEDPKVDFSRGGKYKLDEAAVANLEKLLVQLVSKVSRGPLKYEGRSMKESHQGMKITDEQFGALAADLIEVLKEYKVPQKEMDELIGIIGTTKKDIVAP